MSPLAFSHNMLSARAEPAAMTSAKLPKKPFGSSRVHLNLFSTSGSCHPDLLISIDCFLKSGSCASGLLIDTSLHPTARADSTGLTTVQLKSIGCGSAFCQATDEKEM